MKPFILHINLYDLALLGISLVGLIFSLLLFKKQRDDKAAPLLSLPLLLLSFQLAWLMGTDIQLAKALPAWNKINMPAMLAFGPLLYFYVRKVTRPSVKLRLKDGLHLLPIILAFLSWPQATFTLIFISVCCYLYQCHQLIRLYYLQLDFQQGDRSHQALRWLNRLLKQFGLFWLLWIPCAVATCFDLDIFPEVGLIVAIAFVRMAIVIYLRQEVAGALSMQTPALSAELKQKGRWLQQEMAAKEYYRDAELSLNSLAEKLGLHPHELSRIINTALKKNFNDLINEYRVSEVISHLKDPAFERLTLLGIAYGAGFNSKSSFHRIFKEMTGKSPAEYKKELPTYHLRPRLHTGTLVLTPKTLPVWTSEPSKPNFMFKNYIKVAWRNILKKRSTSFINISGLAVGMAVALLIGLWISGELSFNTYHTNYDRIARVMQSKTIDGTVNTSENIPIPLAAELRSTYGSNFKRVVLASGVWNHILNSGNKQLLKTGSFMQPEAPELMSLRMIRGNRGALNDPSVILLSEGTAKALFGEADPTGKVLRLDNSMPVKVSGVYQDLPKSSSFNDLAFIVPWALYYTADPNLRKADADWGDNGYLLYVQLNDQLDYGVVSAQIKDAKLKRVDQGSAKFRPAISLQPMSRWHLYAEYKNGVNTGGEITYLWLFGLIGIFVLLLACINFMNLSTARSEKRAREVGVRKAIGSLRSQLIAQFFTESVAVALLSFALAFLLAWLALPGFNEIAGKQISMPWTNVLFWLVCISFSIMVGLLAGIYPAFYLSSFNPVSVLKGTFKAGRFSALPRQVLVVVQFTVSVILIVGTVVTFKQVRYSQNRPVGYERNALLTMAINSGTIHKQFNAFRNDLISSGAVVDVAESGSSTTGIFGGAGGLKWSGKDPQMNDEFAMVGISTTYGRTVGWQLVQGRDLSPAFMADSGAVVLNEAAVTYMNLQHPIGETIDWWGKKYQVVGVVKDMVMASPYEPARQTLFFMDPKPGNFLLIRINPHWAAQTAIAKIQGIWKQYSPSEPMDFRFADQEYQKKFTAEQTVGTLAGIFSVLAIFISCMGIFGMAIFVAEQRIKEIGVRKILGASVFNLWRMLSLDFVVLVGIALFVATPVAWYLMHSWLGHYTYHTELSWWVFALTGIGAILITLLTVSWQTIKAAVTSPVKSLKAD